VDKDALDRLFREVVSRTFNQVSVDGDTSTNDMALLMANGMAGNHPLTAADPEFPVFARALEYAASQLAKAIARDGEGASKLLEVKVEGASSDEAARTIARSIARSNLVKAAVFGEDANWGRILCAAGYAGIPFRPEGVNIYLGDLQVCEHGAALPFDEAVALEVLRQPEVLIRVTMSEGRGEGVAWGCDLTYDYVKINASYRT
jgi:glutamate N-acetyltransferase/amino-acid N-acetyltransferase